MKFPIKDFFIKCDQILSFPQIWSHLLKKPLMENFIFCAMIITINVVVVIIIMITNLVKLTKPYLEHVNPE